MEKFEKYYLDIGQFGSPLVLGTRRCRFESYRACLCQLRYVHILRLYWCIGDTKTVTTVDLFIWFKSIRLIYERNECADFKYDIRSGVGISEVRFLYSSLEGV